MILNDGSVGIRFLMSFSAFSFRAIRPCNTHRENTSGIYHIRLSYRNRCCRLQLVTRAADISPSQLEACGIPSLFDFLRDSLTAATGALSSLQAPLRIIQLSK